VAQDQELIGQGLGKIAAAFTSGMPVSASFSRSALNYASDARTGLSSIVTAAFVLIALLYLTPLLWHLPKPVLAAIILQAVAGLIDIKVLVRAWRASRDDGAARRSPSSPRWPSRPTSRTASSPASSCRWR
jgi:Sulfate permease and related transporters (MFS superfamily)